MIMRECKHCNKKFAINKGEFSFFQNKGFDLPTHCPQCRYKKKVVATSYTCELCDTMFILDGLEMETKSKSTCERCNKK